MLYLFTGNSDYLVKAKVKAWKDKFISNYGEFNLIHIKSFDTVDNNFLTLNITSTSFLAEKKLVIIDIESKQKEAYSKNKDNETKAGIKKNNIQADKEELLLNILTKIPDNNIILINIINPDKRTKFYKGIVKLAKVEEFNTKEDGDIQSIISNKYGNKISSQAISTLIRYKSSNLSKIISEIDKLLITYDKIDIKEISDHIVPELEESIFQIVDDLLDNKRLEAINKIKIILNNTVIYALYNNLLANLRTTMYIFQLKHIGLNSNDISSKLDLKNKSFLVNKRYKISYSQLKQLYINILSIDKKMKSGKLVGTEANDFIFELEKEIIKK